MKMYKIKFEYLIFIGYNRGMAGSVIGDNLEAWSWEQRNIKEWRPRAPHYMVSVLSSFALHLPHLISMNLCSVFTVPMQKKDGIYSLPFFRNCLFPLTINLLINP